MLNANFINREYACSRYRRTAIDNVVWRAIRQMYQAPLSR